MVRACKKSGHVAVAVPNKLNIQSHLWHLKATGEGRTGCGYAYFEIKKKSIDAGLTHLEFYSKIKNVSFPDYLWSLFKVLAYFGSRIGYLCTG
ncbi:MAG: hypothetical protein J7M18_01490 [Candidatus Eremiobacteraeota bacterium]|nr:hypothetical protein [Candidatus Eremiobacteraeota bacterium]